MATILVILVSNDQGGVPRTLTVDEGTSLSTFLNQQSVDRSRNVVAINGRTISDDFGETLVDRDCVSLTPKNVKGA